jgi:mono/diheme cytochrome c family protein
MRGTRPARGISSIGIAALLYVCVTGAVSLHAAQDATTPPTSLANALPPGADSEYIWKNNCATCHAVDGTGSPQSVIGFTQPFPNGDSLPDFTDCTTNTVEPFADWNSVIHRGGPIRGLDRHMPAFGDALSDEQIENMVHYLWTFCKDPRWPRGDLNFPRAFFTEKAYPESESVWTTGITGTGAKAVTNNLVYEHRIKQRSQYELTIPVDFQQSGPGGTWNRGLGDVEFALRRSFYANVDRALIIAAGGAVTLPTGRESAGLSEGVTVWEPFAMFAKGLGENGFVQMHGGEMLPSDTKRVANSTYLRQAWGYTYAQDHGFGRAWTPMTEILWSKQKGGKSVVDVVPQMQVSLTKLQHILLSVGVSVPVTERDGRHPQFLTYFLWDWFDGKLTQYWH